MTPLVRISPAFSSRFTTIVVDYGMSLEKMIDAGNYEAIVDDITRRRFPIIGKGKVTFSVNLLGLDDEELTESAIQKHIVATRPKNPWRPAKIEHLLAFGAKFP